MVGGGEVAGEDAGWELRDKIRVDVVVFGGGEGVVEGTLILVCGGFLA